MKSNDIRKKQNREAQARFRERQKKKFGSNIIIKRLDAHDVLHSVTDARLKIIEDKLQSVVSAQPVTTVPTVTTAPTMVPVAPHSTVTIPATPAPLAATTSSRKTKQKFDDQGVELVTDPQRRSQIKKAYGIEDAWIDQMSYKEKDFPIYEASLDPCNLPEEFRTGRYFREHATQIRLDLFKPPLKWEPIGGSDVLTLPCVKNADPSIFGDKPPIIISLCSQSFAWHLWGKDVLPAPLKVIADFYLKMWENPNRNMTPWLKGGELVKRFEGIDDDTLLCAQRARTLQCWHMPLPDLSASTSTQEDNHEINQPEIQNKNIDSIDKVIEPMPPESSALFSPQSGNLEE